MADKLERTILTQSRLDLSRVCFQSTWGGRRAASLEKPEPVNILPAAQGCTGNQREVNLRNSPHVWVNAAANLLPGRELICHFHRLNVDFMKWNINLLEWFSFIPVKTFRKSESAPLSLIVLLLFLLFFPDLLHFSSSSSPSRCCQVTDPSFLISPPFLLHHHPSLSFISLPFLFSSGLSYFLPNKLFFVISFPSILHIYHYYYSLSSLIFIVVHLLLFFNYFVCLVLSLVTYSTWLTWLRTIYLILFSLIPPPPSCLHQLTWPLTHLGSSEMLRCSLHHVLHTRLHFCSCFYTMIVTVHWHVVADAGAR